MCRILGYFGKKYIPNQKIERAISHQFHGGPDQQSYATGNHWALANNRLAIQGLDGGVQPFKFKQFHAVYNGEIYNHKELRKHLLQKGYDIKDPCDGAVILPLYELYGEAFVEYLDGMFVIAIIDEREEPKITLVSDGCAMKSVYYHYDDVAETFFFASELAPLFELSVPRSIRIAAIDEYMVGRSIWHNKTFFDQIYSLPPRTVLIKRLNGRLQVRSYASKMIASCEANNFLGAASQFGKLFEHEVMQMLDADVPVCLVTSGGLDSSYVTALASRYRKPLECFNVSYEGDWPSEERHFAKEVADHCGVGYNQILIKESEFPQFLDETIDYLGQPNSAPHSISTYALFKGVRAAGFKVAMTGEGADEFFGGYSRFRIASYNQNEDWLEKSLDGVCAADSGMREAIYSGNYSAFLKKNGSAFKENVDQLREMVKQKGRLKALLEFDQNERFPSYILRRVDHLSMAHSIEVRIPFCQPKITSFATSLPTDYQVDGEHVKKVVYQAAQGLLPYSILNRPKQSFTLPITAMLSKGHVLFEILNDTLQTQAFRERGFFNYQAIQKLIIQQLREPNNRTADLLWSVMVLERWFQKTENNFNYRSSENE